MELVAKQKLHLYEEEDSFTIHKCGKGEHWCALYQKTEEEYQETIVKFLLEGLQNNEKVGCFIDHHTEEEIKSYFQARNIDLQFYINRGQFTFQCSTRAYEVDSFRTEKVIAKLIKETERALAEGWSKYRVSGECIWILKNSMIDQWMEYEVEIMSLFQEYPCIALCQAIVRTEEFSNFYYIAQNELLNYWIHNLKERKKIENRLKYKTQQLLSTNRKLEAEIAERKQLESAKDAAEALSKAKSEFLAIISHEIRTPLNGIVGMIQLLKQTELTADQKDCISVIDVSSNYLMTVLNDILDFAKVETGKLQLHYNPLSLKQCVEGVVEMFKESQKERRISIVHKIEETVPPYIIGDVSRIRQILFNLVSNACKFSHDGSKIEILVATPDESHNTTKRHSNDHSNNMDSEMMLLFSVKDNGIGIPKEKWANIFTAFTQVDSSITRRYGGTGLGLAICRNLVTMMNGHIWFESELGKGSTFHFTLLVKPTTQQPVEIQSPQRLKRSLSEQSELNILVVDDNAMNIKVIQKILSRAGYGATAVTNGEEALAEVQKRDYDVIFMDLLMPVMSGLQASIAINGMDWTKRRKPVIVAMTACSSVDDIKSCEQAGIEIHLSKPVIIEQVYNILDTVMSKKKRIC